MVEDINPLTPGMFCKKCVFDILVLFKLDLGQISFNPVKNAFATQGVNFINGLTKKPKIQIFQNFWRFLAWFRQITQIYHKRTHLLEIGSHD